MICSTYSRFNILEAGIALLHCLGAKIGGFAICNFLRATYGHALHTINMFLIDVLTYSDRSVAMVCEIECRYLKKSLKARVTCIRRVACIQKKSRYTPLEKKTYRVPFPILYR